MSVDPNRMLAAIWGADSASAPADTTVNPSALLDAIWGPAPVRTHKKIDYSVSKSSASSGSSNSGLFPDFLGPVVSPIGDVLRPVAGGGRALAEGTIQGLYNAADAAVTDVKNHPASAALLPFGVFGAPIAANLISAAEGGGGGHLYKDVAKPIAESYAAKYGPAFHGDFATTLHRMAADPVGTFLDAATLAALPFTAGGSAVARSVGLARLAEAGQVLREGRVLEATTDAGKAVRTERAGEAVKVGGTNSPLRGVVARKLYDPLSRKLPDTVGPITNPLSMTGRIALHNRAYVAADALKARAVASHLDAALVRLSAPQKMAASLIAHGIDRISYRRMVDENQDVIRQQIHAEHEAEVARHRASVDKWHGYATEGKSARTVLKNAEKLGIHATSVADARAQAAAMTEEQLDGQARLMAGPERGYDPATHIQAQLALLDEHAAEIDKLTANWKSNTKLFRAVVQIKRAGEAMRKLNGISEDTANARLTRPRKVAAGSRYATEVMKAEHGDLIAAHAKAVKQGDHIGILANEDALQRAGLEVENHQLTGWTTPDPVRLEELGKGIQDIEHGLAYMPHTGPTSAGGRAIREAYNYLVDAPRIPDEMRHSQMIRFQLGDIMLNPQNLSRVYLKAANFRHVKDVWRWALTYAEPLTSNVASGGIIPGLKPGYRLIRVETKNGRPNAAAVPRVLREHEAFLNSVNDMEGTRYDRRAQAHQVNDLTGDLFPNSHDSRVIDMEAGQAFMQVPEHIARMATAEVRQSTNAALLFYDHYMAAWRSMVLYLRPAWLVNNIFGQHLLFTLHHMERPWGLMRAWYQAAEPKVGKARAEQIRAQGERMLTPGTGSALDRVSRHLPTPTAQEAWRAISLYADRMRAAAADRGVTLTLNSVEDLRQYMLEGTAGMMRGDTSGGPRLAAARVPDMHTGPMFPPGSVPPEFSNNPEKVIQLRYAAALHELAHFEHYNLHPQDARVAYEYRPDIADGAKTVERESQVWRIAFDRAEYRLTNDVMRYALDNYLQTYRDAFPGQPLTNIAADLDQIANATQAELQTMSLREATAANPGTQDVLLSGTASGLGEPARFPQKLTGAVAEGGRKGQVLAVAGLAPKAYNRAVNAMQAANREGADNLTRLATEVTSLSRIPELRKVYKAAQGWEGAIGEIKMLMRDFTPIPAKALGEKVTVPQIIERLPLHLAEKITKRGSDMLGDYRVMTPFERRVLYRAIPFWGWYRTIGAISLRLPIENPARVLFVKNLEDAAQESGNGVPKFEVPSWLRGAVALGGLSDGTTRMVSVTGLNPFQTDVQVAQAVSSLPTGQPVFGSEGPLSLASPVASSGLQALGFDPFYGGRYQGVGAGSGPIGRFLAGQFTGLPQYRLTQQTTGYGGYHSTLYKNSTLEYLANYLGLPIKDVVDEEAKRRAAEGQ